MPETNKEKGKFYIVDEGQAAGVAAAYCFSGQFDSSL